MAVRKAHYRPLRSDSQGPVCCVALALLLWLVACAPLTVSAGPSPSGKKSSEAVAQNASVFVGPDETSEESTRKIALTFDAGSSGEEGETILKALKKENVKCTFFVTGEFAQKYPNLLKKIAADGHEIGNHTWSHPDLRRLSSARITRELARTEAAIQKICGVSTKPYFRPPFGARNTRVLRAARSAGYECVFWTAGGQDASPRYRGISAESIRKMILKKIKPGGVILCHVGSAGTAKMLPQLLKDLKAKGYTLVPVSGLDGPIPH